MSCSNLIRIPFGDRPAPRQVPTSPNSYFCTRSYDLNQSRTQFAATQAPPASSLQIRPKRHTARTVASYLPLQPDRTPNNLSSIGNFLSSPYDSDEEDEIVNLSKIHFPPVARAWTVGKAQGDRNDVSPRRDGGVDEDDNDDWGIVRFPAIRMSWRQSKESDISLPPAITIHPTPCPVQHTPPRYPAASRPPLLSPSPNDR